MSKKYKFNTRWDKNRLKCACLHGNEACDRYRGCEVLEFEFNPYSNIKECMKERAYIRHNGAIRQK